MARTSGPVTHLSQSELPREMQYADERSGNVYRIHRSDTSADLQIAGEALRLPWFIGSGAAARSFLLARDGYLCQSPVSYYSRTKSLQLSPGYARYTTPYLTRAINPGCLVCHTTGVRHLSNSQNRYADPPFEEPGVGCERCHGPGSEHASSPAKHRIVNPAKLDAARRDSVCEQCHLSGLVRVVRSRRSVDSFRPGDLFSDHIGVFVAAGQPPQMTVTGHVENLAASACKRAAGDRMWCGTCHSPHGQTVDVRARCRSCHIDRPCTAPVAVRAAKSDDCLSCHMPKSTVTDADHVVYTDHSIPRRPRSASPGYDVRNSKLTPFGSGVATARDEALAYAIGAQKVDSPAWRSRAWDLLRASGETNPNDMETQEYLAVLAESKGEVERSIRLYERIIAADPGRVTPFVNLGAIRMRQGRLEDAVRLWREALVRNPGLMLVRSNLATALENLGRRDEAISVLTDSLRLNPAFRPAREHLQRLKPAAGPQ